MVSSKKPNQEKKPKSDGGVTKAPSRNTSSSGSKTKKKKKTNAQAIVKKEPEVHEISESSSSDSVEEARRDDAKKSNGVGGVEDAKMIRFPMNRIRRIMRSDNSAPQIMQDAVFLVNKATELFIERFSEEAYESSVQDKKKFIHYKHLSSVVSNDERYEFLADCVPEKLKAEVALQEWEKSMMDAG
ncbi:hypothetical protein N665_1060s0014 [Sinapis alba]|nr:hypothetical protein N665_1060s0014 [Sinapis alba]